MRADPSTARRRHRSRPALWNELHAELLRDIKLTRSSWSSVQAGCAELGTFDDPVDAVAWLHTRDMLDEKDRAYRHLVGIAQRAEGSARRLARAIVWLGLWPAFDRRVADLVRRGHDPHDIVVDYTTSFLRAIDAFTSSRVNRVFATIVHNTARRARHIRKSKQPDQLVGVNAGLTSDADIVSGHFELMVLRRELAAIVDDDADLIILSAIVGLTYEEIGNHVQLRPATVNKRVLRAITRLRTTKRNGRENFFSGFAATHRFSFDVNHKSARCSNHAPGSERPLATKQVGTSRYCDECADFLLASAVRHVRGSSCLISGDEGPGICPACLVDVFRVRGDQP